MSIKSIRSYYDIHHAFLFQQTYLPLYHLALTLPMETTDAAIGRYDTVAGHCRSKEITFQCLTNGLGTAAPYALS